MLSSKRVNGLNLARLELIFRPHSDVINGLFVGLCETNPEVGNRQSIAGRIDCMILSAGHIHPQFESFFCLKNTQYYVTNLLSVHAELFFTAKIRDFSAFFMPRKQHVQ